MILTLLTVAAVDVFKASRAVVALAAIPGIVGTLVDVAGHAGAAVGSVIVRTGGTRRTSTAGPIRAEVLQTGLTGTAVDVTESNQASRALPAGAVRGEVITAPNTGTTIGTVVVLTFSTDKARATGTIGGMVLGTGLAGAAIRVEIALWTVNTRGRSHTVGGLVGWARLTVGPTHGEITNRALDTLAISAGLIANPTPRTVATASPGATTFASISAGHLT